MMSRIDLGALAGFSLSLQDEQLVFGEGVLVEETKTRRRRELAPVALEPQACVPPEEIQYWMFNGVARGGEETRLRTSPLRYELTLILPRPLGSELPKTLGHIHNAPTTRSPTYPEAFQVLHGVAHFLIYTFDARVHAARLCSWMEALEGDLLLMPPGLYHLAINAGAEPLVFADLLSRRALGLYDDVRLTQGAPYYETVTGEWLRNPMFRDTAPLERVSPLLLDSVPPLYLQFVQYPGSFSFLDEPQSFPDKYDLARI